MCTASQDTPTKSEIAITPITVSVFAAFRPCGARNALTPFEIDSTPVRAAAPDENARRRTKSADPAGRPDGDRVRARAPAGSRRRRTRDPGPDHGVHHRDEGVGRQRERDPGLADPAQVDEREQQDNQRARARPCARQRGRGRGDREHAGGDRHRDREDVVDEQRRGGDEARQRAEVLLRDDVRAAARLVRPDGLACTRGRRSPAPRRSRSRPAGRGGRRSPTRRAGRRAPPRSRRRPTRAGRTRRSAARASSRGACRQLRRRARRADQGALDV